MRARWWSAIAASGAGGSPAQMMRGRRVTLSIARAPVAFVPISPTASSSYRSITKPAEAANYRKNSMWHDERDATNASSGSTASARDSGSRTSWGELDASTTAPPSNRHSWARG